jgi:hypothetical protein
MFHTVILMQIFDHHFMKSCLINHLNFLIFNTLFSISTADKLIIYISILKHFNKHRIISDIVPILNHCSITGWINHFGLNYYIVNLNLYQLFNSNHLYFWIDLLASLYSQIHQNKNNLLFHSLIYWKNLFSSFCQLFTLINNLDFMNFDLHWKPFIFLFNQINFYSFYQIFILFQFIIRFSLIGYSNYYNWVFYLLD